MEPTYPTTGSESTGLHKSGSNASSSGEYGASGSATASRAARLRDELSMLKSDLDALMSHSSTLNENELQEARDRILARFSSMRHAARGIAEQATRQLSHGRDMTVDYVKDKPLQSVALAAGLGLLIGTLLRRS
jgi:ElaB/YqjD/DUF883 family membrane-anchored ribosome-binding protein